MMSNFSRRFHAVLLIAMCSLVVFAGCSGSNNNKITSIAVTPSAASIAPGATQQFKATAQFANGGSSDVSSTVTWSSGTPSVATISGTGLATAVAGGSSTITASSQGVSGTATLTVVSLTSIAITPSTATVAIAGTQQFTATGTFSNSTTTDITGQVTWNSATASVATIDAAGLATGVAAGSSNITATFGAITSTTPAVLTVSSGGVSLVSITVTPATPTAAVGTAVDFVATGHFSDSSTQVLTNAAWTSGTTATATIISPDGIAVAQAAGSSVITATSGAISGNTTLTVAPAVARTAYVPGSADGNTAQYLVQSATASLIPVGSGHANNLPTQILPEPTGRFAYSLNANEILTLSLDQTSGRIAQLTSTLSTTVAANQGAIDPTGRYLYVAGTNGTGNFIFAYKINLTDGSLTAIGSPIAAGTFPFGVVTDRAGKFVYITDQDSASNKVFAFSIQPGGGLAPLATASYATGNTPQLPAIDPSNTHLFIPNSGDSTITVFTINADGSLTAVAGSPFGTGIGGSPEVAAVDFTGKFLYVSNAADNTISAVSIGAGGVLGAAVAGSPFVTGTTPFGIAIDPSNTMLAVANLFSSSVSLYSLAPATGVLTPAALPQVESAANPFFVNFGIGLASPSVNPGSVFAPNAVSNDLSAFTSTAATGVLSPAATPTVTGITGNSFAAADQAGSLLFTGSATGTQLAGFSIDQTTGGLLPLGGSPFAVAGTDVASSVLISPQSKFVYALDSTTGSVVQYAVNQPAGTVSSPGLPTAAFTGANNLAADPQGLFIYALGNNITNGIQPYTTYLTFPALSLSAQQTPLPGNWTSGAVDASGLYLVAADSTAKTIQLFTITAAGTADPTNPDGNLTPTGTAVTLSGTGPWLVAFDPKNRAIFVADEAAGTITPYPFNSTTGTIGAAGAATTALPSGITQITTDPAGNFVYAGVKAAGAPPAKGAVAVYKIGAAGALTVVAGSPFAAGTGNSGVAATNVVQ